MKLVKDLISENFQSVPCEKGYYTWWFTEEKTIILLEKINKELADEDKIIFSNLKKNPYLDYYALYFGIACSKEGLNQRIKWHTAKINGHTDSNVKRGTLSTLRQTISGLNEWYMIKSSSQVDDFISDCYWEWKTAYDPERMEKYELENNCYPLNIKGNKRITKECRKRLKEMRKKYRI